ncbi:GH36 C-terminal domain-containing protein [Aeribacillus pallidus]|uniref:GH36 C-terminal domain-containing protein n=1 Tax=Aeribacillus TaxID=1055323 RepID=UPI0007B472CF|nr:MULTISPECIES: GH36 C-terminal domain-containing protein [Aeribacillus]KZM55941.1 hypothetical protein A3Q35_10715 [Aeribacillus pallidus]MED0651218.1 GH36 C-terminal domain-containing protein [Aeribacillus composti]MED4486535.1 GH36 C-terminal domain-containing protein [Aeribacillus pallidus]
MACMVVSKDQKEALVGYYQVLAKPNHGYSRILLKGLNGDFEYEIKGVENTFFGDELMNVGIQLTNNIFDARFGVNESGDFSSKLFKLKAKEW